MAECDFIKQLISFLFFQSAHPAVPGLNLSSQAAGQERVRNICKSYAIAAFKSIIMISFMSLDFALV
jgi:hypothetical protein